MKNPYEFDLKNAKKSAEKYLKNFFKARGSIEVGKISEAIKHLESLMKELEHQYLSGWITDEEYKTEKNHILLAMTELKAGNTINAIVELESLWLYLLTKMYGR